MKLSIFCNTHADAHARLPLQLMSNLARVLGAELVVGVNDHNAKLTVLDWGVTRAVFTTDLARQQCRGDWVLELHDDEAASAAMVRWLWSGQYRDQCDWKFPLLCLWPDERSVLIAPKTFPNWQLRLRNQNNSGLVSFAPVSIESHALIDQPTPTTGILAAKGDGAVPWTPQWTKPVNV